MGWVLKSDCVQNGAYQNGAVIIAKKKKLKNKMPVV